MDKENYNTSMMILLSLTLAWVTTVVMIANDFEYNRFKKGVVYYPDIISYEVFEIDNTLNIILPPLYIITVK